MSGFADIWVYLSATPLLWLGATLAAYLLGEALHRAAGGSPLVNPVAVAVALLILVLLATGTSYQTYFDGAQFVHFLLGPATVALAVPLRQNWSRVRRAALPLAAALLAGSVTAVLAATGTAALMGAGRDSIASIAPKSATTPIAMAVAERIGGLPSLTAALVIVTGILGAMLAGPVLGAMRIGDPRARGTALGTAAHGIGTARAFELGEVAGTFAGIAMALNGLATAVLVPVLMSLPG
ncbi:LrgB family protein [Arenibaculum pallidiluteum]|uniref:LrgB family protein n=1 Tax=Arenibaculum pallidiluteum TaxID=2812559 RepID=UPI001A96BD02|nr:LrgB family protein [Arenibaculum pallidiluteum]